MGTLLEKISAQKNSSSQISDARQTFSYPQFLELCESFRSLLSPVKKGQIVCGQIQSQPHLLAAMVTSLDAGFHFLPIFENSTSTEIQRIIDSINPHWILQNFQEIFPTQNSGSVLELEPGAIFQTSGSTGHSRFVYQSEELLFNNAGRAVSYQGINANSKIFSPLTLSHGGGLNMQTLPGVLNGASVHFAKKSSWKELQGILDGEFTHGILIPFHFRKIFKSPRWSTLNFGNKLTIVTGSSPIPREFYKLSEEKGIRLIGVYGLTEIGPFVSCFEKSLKSSPQLEFPLGSGLPDYQMRISEEGEIQVKGPCTGVYLERPNIGDWNNRLCGSPWVSTGDLGVKEGDQYYYKGRTRRQINLTGFKINPEEVEGALLSHPSVQDCLVYAQPDPALNEIPAVKVVAPGATAYELKAFLKKHLNSMKVPRVWELVDKLEKTSIDKTRIL